ncbi:MAG: ABC transporter substrate-binding protein [Aureliella sp.]
MVLLVSKHLFAIKLAASAALLLAIGISVGCTGTGGSDTTSTGLDKVTLMLNWYPEAEHGGFYAAKVHGIYEKYGLEVEIRPGGPTAPVAQELVAGRVQFAIGNADDVLVFREQDVPVVALMAPIQNTPRCILVHASSDATSLKKLGGMKMQAGAGRPYLAFMESKGLLEDVQLVPYSGVPNLVSDANSAMQGYSFSEPMLAKEEGLDVRMMMVSDIGFNPYASCLIATEEYIGDESGVVQRMVTASREGWEKYLREPAETHKAILEANKHGMTEAALDYGVQELKPLCVTDDVPLKEVGSMSVDRWETLVQQFSEIELLSKDKVAAGDVYTLDFLTN